MKDFIKTREDNGGVHLNSGIPNRAFYGRNGNRWLRGKSGLCGTTRFAIATAQDADFDAFAKLTIAHGEKRSGSDVGAAIKQAREQVGVL